ncbi:3-biphosphoglycerate-independent phosphoglycerate mutase family protein [Salix suchowensis]|nr:3-biphosphoglycerate-independent phosphoglycerate mutase family protein [Salix suchowensis]
MESPFKANILKGKVALITGGGSGIGFEISTQFGKHGASVAIMGRRKQVVESAAASLQSLGISAAGFEGDVRKQEDAKRVLESAFKLFGKIDILVNGAAGNFLVSPEALSPNGFRTVLDIDAVGTFTMCHEALPYLKKGGLGQSYLEAAVDAIGRNLALEWGTDYDIRVNGIAPGPIGDTPGMSKLAPEEINSKAKDFMPLYKLGEKWDIAMAALYLASEAGKYINGTTLVVDGGLWLSRPRHLPKDAVKQLSRAVEKRSRNAPAGVPSSKL